VTNAIKERLGRGLGGQVRESLATRAVAIVGKNKTSLIKSAFVEGGELGSRQ